VEFATASVKDFDLKGRAMQGAGLVYAAGRGGARGDKLTTGAIRPQMPMQPP
jgi:hypothetical protein